MHFLISIVGLPGSGKSTIARRVATRLNLKCVDVDEEVERQTGLSIVEYFAAFGEASFRDAEAACLDTLTLSTGSVLATGGGAVLREESRRRLRERSLVTYLHTPPDKLIHRVRGSARPLFANAKPGETLRRLYAERDGYYREAAHHVIECAELSAAAVAERIAHHAEAVAR